MSDTKHIWLVDSSDPSAVNAVLKMAKDLRNGEVIPLTSDEFKAWTEGRILRVEIGA